MQTTLQLQLVSRDERGTQFVAVRLRALGDTVVAEAVVSDVSRGEQQQLLTAELPHPSS